MKLGKLFLLLLLINSNNCFCGAVSPEDSNKYSKFGKLLDRIIARVGSNIIYYSDIKRKISEGYTIQFSDYPAKSSNSKFIRLLEDEINIMLVMQEAKKLRIEVSDHEVESEISRMLKSQNMTRKSLDNYLHTQHKTYKSYVSDMKKALTLAEFKKHHIFPYIKRITDEDIKNDYIKTSNSSTKDRLIVLESLKISFPPSSPEHVVSAKKVLSEQAYAKIKAGENMDQVARVYADGSKTNVTNYLIKSLGKEVQEKIVTLRVGDITKPIKLSDGFYIFKINSQKITKSADYKDKKDEIEQKLREEKVKDIIKRWIINTRRQNKPITLKDN